MAKIKEFVPKYPVKEGDRVKVNTGYGKVIITMPQGADVLMDDNSIAGRPYDQIELVEERR